MEQRQVEAFKQILVLGSTAHGRILMMRALADTDTPLDDNVKHLYAAILRSAPVKYQAVKN